MPKSTYQKHFDMRHNQAFRKLGALEAGQHWSAFDVPRQAAQVGMAKRFVTTIWNYRKIRSSTGDQVYEPAIAQDIKHGTFWYQISRPYAGATRTWIAHWNGLNLALKNQIPIIGVLKDIHSNRCSSTCIFDCAKSIMQRDDNAIWLQLIPHDEIGSEVRPIDIEEILARGLSRNALVSLEREFESAVMDAQQSTSEQRRARLANAARVPTRTEAFTTIFIRNPDVVAEVLFRAAGKCEHCKNPAPFIRRSNGTPYLEVHHKIPLAQDGEDTVENAFALCPNCHRKAHYA